MLLAFFFFFFSIFTCSCRYDGNLARFVVILSNVDQAILLSLDIVTLSNGSTSFETHGCLVPQSRGLPRRDE